MNDWLRITAIGGDDYECRMTVRKADDTTITVTRPWHHHWTDGWDWKTIIRQWLSDVPETFEPYDGLAEWLRDADDSQTCNLPPCYGGHRLQTDMTAYDLLLELGVIDDPYARNKERD